MKHKIFVTHPIPDVGLALLRKERFIQLVVRRDLSTISRSELLRGARGSFGILCQLTDKVDRVFLQANKNTLRVVANYAVGYDNIDVTAAHAFKITVGNTPVPEMSVAVAEHTVALMFALAKRLSESDQFVRTERYHGFGPELFNGHQLAGKTVGIVGLGRIGREVAKRAVAMGLHVIYHSTKPDPAFEHEFGAHSVSLGTLLGRSDFVTLHVPLTPQTHHLIDASALRKMKQTAFLINTSRGPVIDEKALVAALKKRLIAGAGLDVYEYEPRLTPGLTKLKNVVLTPHIASATRENRDAMAVAAAQNILAVLHGKKPPYQVNVP